MEEYKCVSFFAMETASEYKYQIAMETAEQKTSCHKLHSAISPSILHRFSQS